MNALALGLLVRKKWLMVIALNFFLLLVFSIHPYTLFFVNTSVSEVEFSFPFAWMHTIAFLVLLSPLSRRSVLWIKDPSTKLMWVGTTILFFIGTFIQHLTGNILFETILGMFLNIIPYAAFPAIWTTIFWLYPIERTILIIASSIVGVIIIRSIRAMGFKNFITIGN